jgi:hypothetical protein
LDLKDLPTTTGIAGDGSALDRLFKDQPLIGSSRKHRLAGLYQFWPKAFDL